MKKGLLVCLAVAVSVLNAATLVKDGTSEYAIVQGANGVWDEFAADELREFIERSTGVRLEIVSNAVSSAAVSERRALPTGVKHFLYVGDCAAAKATFGSETLADQESLVTEDTGFLGLFGGGDIWFRGGGNAGSSYAVYHFAEEELGFRSFTADPGGEKIDRHATLKTSGRELRRRPHFPLQRLTHHMPMYGTNEQMFVFRNFGTLSKASWTRKNKMRGRLENDHPERDSGHGFGLYIPCARFGMKKSGHAYYEWDEEIDFFETHPEYFSLTKSGERSNCMQLCFSNKGLQAAFTKRVLERCRRVGGTGVLTIGANDVPGAFCNCPECEAAAKREETPGGAFFEYVPSLCAAVKEKYPKIMISSLAYRKQQTEPPPKDMLVRGVKMPDNWICDFAPVDDDQGKNLDAPVNAETLEHIRQWSKLTPNITYWYYLCVGEVPVAPVTRLARDLKLMDENGVTGAALCGYSTPSLGRLQLYLFHRLCVDPNQDAWAIAREFAAHEYGPAADDVMAYWREVDDVFMAQKGFVMLDQKAISFHCYTPEMVVRWQELFDAAEKKVTPGTYQAQQLAIARWDLDSLTIRLWRTMGAAMKKAGTDSAAIFKRMRAVKFPYWPHDWDNGKKRLDTLELVLKADSKPLPKELADLPADQVYQFPTTGGNWPREDKEAACGKAATEPLGRMTNKVNYINWYDYGFNEKKYGGRGKLDITNVKGGAYKCYYLGKGKILPTSVLTFCSWWGIMQQLGELYPEGDAERAFEFWASFKFTGPDFGVPEKDGKNRVWCERLFVVDRNGKKYKGKE